jgi:DNA-binding beta-propeller fold protein YncE
MVFKLTRILCKFSFAGVVVLMAFAASMILFGSSGLETRTNSLGAERLVGWEPLPEAGAVCELLPVSAMLPPLQRSTSTGAATAATDESIREEVAKRQPIRTIRDPHAAPAGIAVDPVRNEVVIADENQFGVHVYDRMENTPPRATMSEPKRLIRGENTFLEYACSVYIDPANGEIYAVNNDTMNWVPVFGRDAKGDAAPIRKLATPHTTFGIAADEQEQELFFTIQDDHAVVVFKKTAKDDDPAVRTLQGPRTLLADPHGIALDPKTGLIYVSNWGSNNRRVTPPEGPEKPNWPIGRDHNIPSSGKFDAPSITVYPKGAKGDTQPLRVIQGPKTDFNWPTALAVHPERGELFVANDTGDSVAVFRTDANGDVAPIRVLKGPQTLIRNPTGVALDLKNNELWVANFGSHAATVFKVDASGNAAPLRVIRTGPLDAPAPMLGNPHTIAFDTKRGELLVGN